MQKFAHIALDKMQASVKGVCILLLLALVGLGAGMVAPQSAQAISMNEDAFVRAEAVLMDYQGHKAGDILEVDLRDLNLTYDELDLFTNQLHFYGEFFWVDTTGDKIGTPENPTAVLRYKLLYDPTEIDKLRTTYEANIKSALSRVKKGMNAAEKAHVLYDWVIRNTSYAEENLQLKNKLSSGVLIHKKANCNGYTVGTEVLFHRAGLETDIVFRLNPRDEEKERPYYEAKQWLRVSTDHSWNLIKVSGNWYHVDTTWGEDWTNNTSIWSPTKLCHRFFMFIDVESLTTSHNNRWGWYVLGTGARFGDHVATKKYSIHYKEFRDSKGKVTKVEDMWLGHCNDYKKFYDSFTVSGITYSVYGTRVADVKTVKTTKKSKTIPKTVKYKGITYTVRGIKANALKKSPKLKTLTVKANVYSSRLQDCLAGSKVTTLKCAKAKVSTYKKYFAPKISGRTVKVKRY